MSSASFLILLAAISCVNSISTPSLESSYSYQVIIGSQLQENSLEGNSLPTFTNTGVSGSGSLGSTIPQAQRKVEIGDVTMIVGGEGNSSAVCLKEGQVLDRFFVCNSAQDVRPSPSGFVVFCESGLINLYDATTCHLSLSFTLSSQSTAAVLSSPDNVTTIAYINGDDHLVPYEFGIGEDGRTLYTSNEIISTFGTCSSIWSPRTYNNTHFILDCPTINKRFFVNGFVSNSNKEVPTGPLFINPGADEAVIITGDRSISFYWKGFTSQCIINFPMSAPLLTDSTVIDFGKNNGKTVIVVFNGDSIFTFDTSRGCRDEYLWKLNITYPCVTGNCDGYYILDDDGCILAVNNRSNKISLDLFFNNVTATPHTVTNLQELPYLLNVNKSKAASQVSSMTSSQMITPSATSSSPSSSSLSITSSPPPSSLSITPSPSPSSLSITSSLTSTTSSPQPSSSPTLLPSTKSDVFVICAFVIVSVLIVIIITGVLVITVCCVFNHQKGKKPKDTDNPQSPGNVMVHSTSTSTNSTEEPSEVIVMEESGLTTEPIPASRSTNSFGDYKRPTPEKSSPDPASLV